MKHFMIECTPGYQLSGGISAFTARRSMATGVNRIQRVRLGRIAATTNDLTDVPGSMSAPSFVRRT
jgi:hypothetical protein